MVMVRTQVAVGIVGHPARIDQIDRLAEQVVPDLVLVDDDGLGCGLNHILTLENTYERALDTGRDWVCVLEDDAIPVPGFRTHLDICLEYSPSLIVSLYLGTGYPQQYQRLFSEAVEQDACWIKHRWMRHAVAYCVHVDVVESLLDQMKTLVSRRWAPDDAIGEFCQRENIMVGYTNPSLVDHQDGKSVVANRTHRGHATFGRNKVRKAHKFGVPEYWNDKSVEV